MSKKGKGKQKIDLSPYFNEDNAINDFPSGKYVNQFGKLGYVKKADGKYIFIQIGAYKLKDFNKIDNGIDITQYEFKFEGIKKVFKGTEESLRKELTPNIISSKGTIARDFISDLILKNPTKIRKEINGGYGSLEDIEDIELKSKDLENIQKHIIKYMSDNFTDEMINAFRLLIIIPFHWILKNDVDVNDKHFIKGLSLYGWKDCGKTFIVNFVLNMFKKEKIKFIGVDSFRSPAGFYGALRETVGILLVDECNNLLKRGGEDMSDIINGLNRVKISRQGTEGGGAITNDNYTSTPVFTSNNRPPFKKSNLARVDIIKMTKTFNPAEKFKLGKGKKLLYKFGSLIAKTFKDNYADIIECDNPIDASNIILERMPLDLSEILAVDFHTIDNVNELPINIQVRKDMEEKMHKEIYYSTIDEYLYLFDWILKFNQDTGLFQIDINKFYDYLEYITEDSSRNFKEDVKTLPMKKSSMRLNGEKINTYSIREIDLLNWLGVEADEGESYPKINSEADGEYVCHIREDLKIKIKGVPDKK